MSKEELKARLAAMGTDGTLIEGYLRGIADLIKTHNLRASNMGAMTLSRGGEYGNQIALTKVGGGTGTTQGFSGVKTYQRPYIPLANYKKAGTKVWTAADCDIPEQMMQIEYDFKAANSLPDAMPFAVNLHKRNVLWTFERDGQPRSIYMRKAASRQSDHLFALAPNRRDALRRNTHFYAVRFNFFFNRKSAWMFPGRMDADCCAVG
jgi:hypothetical protein